MTRLIALSFFALGTVSCSAAPSTALAPPPEVVATPVYSCPAPPEIANPYEPVRELVPQDASNPDRVLKSAVATISSLEATLNQCKAALEVYRRF